jgi:hypothetical protein
MLEGIEQLLTHIETTYVLVCVLVVVNVSLSL